MSPVDRSQLLSVMSDIVCAFLQKNSLRPSDVPELVAQVYAAVEKLGVVEEPAPLAREPAVPIGRSVHRDYIVCLEDGQKLKTLRRYLMRVYGMTPEEYRRKWGLPADYPMVAPGYSEHRRHLAMKIGFGRGGRRSKPLPSPTAADPVLDPDLDSASHYVLRVVDEVDDIVPAMNFHQATRG